MNAYIKSESFAGTGNISYPGVRSTCRPQQLSRKKEGEGGLLFYAGLLKCLEILMSYYKTSFSSLHNTCIFNALAFAIFILFLNNKDVSSFVFISHVVARIELQIKASLMINW